MLIAKLDFDIHDFEGSFCCVQHQKSKNELMQNRTGASVMSNYIHLGTTHWLSSSEMI